VPGPTWGERVHAVVTRWAGTEPTEDELLAYARRTIAGSKVPRSVEIRDQPLPLSGAGKIPRRSLRDESVARSSRTCSTD
jgi:long-chain acyl-CoA synthetase